MICPLSPWLSLIENSNSLSNPRCSRYFYIKSNSRARENMRENTPASVSKCCKTYDVNVWYMRENMSVSGGKRGKTYGV